MQGITNGRLKLVGLALAGLLVAVGMLGIFSNDQSVAAVSNASTPEATKIYLSTSSIPLRVSGVVEAAESTVVYAETAGVVQKLPAREGAMVSVGAMLSIQATPVANAEVQLAAAKRDLTTLQQAEKVTMQDSSANQATIRAYSAAEIARLRTLGDDNRLTETSTALRTGLEQSVLAVTEAINYVHQNRPQFSAEGLHLYDQVVAELYGSIPNYFHGGPMRSVDSAADITAALTAIDSLPDSAEATVALAEVTALLQSQLQVLGQLFATAESDIFDRRSELSTAAVQAAYLSEREAVLAALQALTTTEANFQQVLDGILEEAVSLDTNVQVAAIDESLAAAQAAYAKQIAAQSAVVAEAGKVVAEARQALGRVTAPFAGTVSAVHVEVGQYVQPGTPLVTLVGNGARELVVSIPAYLLPSIATGDLFTINNEQAGFVDRFSSVAEGGSATAVISLGGEKIPTVGTSVIGTVELVNDDAVFMVPRGYLHFDASGPYILYENGERSGIEIVYDSGRELFVSPEFVQRKALMPAVSTSL